VSDPVGLLLWFGALTAAAALAFSLVGMLLMTWHLDRLSAAAYLEWHQAQAAVLRRLLPAATLFTILVLLPTAALTSRADGLAFALVSGALVCFASTLAISSRLIAPLNREVEAWRTVREMPPDWMIRREAWRAFHRVRAVIAVFGFCLLLMALLTQMQ